MKLNPQRPVQWKLRSRPALSLLSDAEFAKVAAPSSVPSRFAAMPFFHSIAADPAVQSLLGPDGAIREDVTLADVYRLANQVETAVGWGFRDASERR